MTKQQWLQALITLALVWGLAIVWVGRRIETRLNGKVREWIAMQDSSQEGGRLSDLQINMDGQWAMLGGRMRSAEEARQIRDWLVSGVRIEGGGGFNPVTKVLISDDFRVVSQPAGWLAIGAVGTDLRVVGVCASAAEREVLEQMILARWTMPGAKSDIRLEVDSRRFDECERLERTVNGLQMTAKRGGGSVQFLQVRLGEVLGRFDLASADEEMAAHAIGNGVGGQEWIHDLRPLVESLRIRLVEEVEWEQRQEELAALPPAHVFLAIKGPQVLLRGEVYGTDEHRGVIASVMAAYPDLQILDDIRARGQRRPTALVSAELPTRPKGGAKALFFGQAGKGWAPVDWEVERHDAPWGDLLLPGLEIDELQPDIAVSVDWLQGGNAGIPRLALDSKRPFLTLCFYDGRLAIGGEVAQESERAQISAAVRTAYPSGWVLDDQINLSTACEPTESLIDTVTTLPPAPIQGFRVAVTQAGSIWTVLENPAALGEPSDLAQRAEEGELAGLSPNRVAEALQRPLEEVRALGLLKREQMEGNEK